ncbi:MAG: hypothetical protein TH68_08365 [Candidatus Synechococcus spongiarum 142]|uniref:Uncharacterized protein n=1 Tax=Candidatus Synechococcus spongiarum 142 TaxID=1608213 RepID=A0A6N3X4W9_9SYNE|nr:MAG: hypothetical protein TH68_08365 [Candidatus Synechococcus spongiarum 142]
MLAGPIRELAGRVRGSSASPDSVLVYQRAAARRFRALVSGSRPRPRSGAQLDELRKSGAELLAGEVAQSVEAGPDQGATGGGDAGVDGALLQEVEERVVLGGEGERGPDDGGRGFGPLGLEGAIGVGEPSLDGGGFVLEAAFEVGCEGIRFAH